MCRADVDPAARDAVAALLIALRDALCKQTGTDPELARIGPIDLGAEE